MFNYNLFIFFILFKRNFYQENASENKSIKLKIATIILIYNKEKVKIIKRKIS